MSIVRYKIRNMEPFKDGNVLEGRFVKAMEILEVSEDEKKRMEQSGAALEILETLVPNPLRRLMEVAEVVAEVDEAKRVVERIEPEKTPELAKLGTEPKLEIKRKAGRPKKVVNG